MTPSVPLESRKLAFLTAVFILLFFTLFTYSGLFAYFTFDDGTAVVANQGHFDVPMWKNFVNVLTVFTTAYRPLATLFWRPMYAIFGYDPFPFRVAIHLLIILNIWLAYVFAKRLEVTKATAALTALVFCYNASMSDLFYDSCTVTDPLCLLFYLLSAIAYVGGRQKGELLSRGRIAMVLVCYMLALDSKELAVALPGILTIYEVLWHHRDLRDRQKALRVGAVLAAMFLIGILFLKVKVPDMGQNGSYKPHATVGFVITNIGLYLGQILYRPETSFTPLGGMLVLAAFLAAGTLVRSRAAIFGTLFFAVGLVPVAIIPHRAAYCAYIPYVGLSLAAAAIASNGRELLVKALKKAELETPSIVGLFVLAVILLGWGHIKQWKPRNQFFEWFNPQVTSFMENVRRTIPDFPPGARVLIAEDPWAGDWGPMFLIELMYHDGSVWVDRPKNMDKPPDPSSYDLVVKYHEPMVDLAPPKILGIPIKWQTRGSSGDIGTFTVSSGNGAASHVDFSPQVVRGSQAATLTVPGLSSVAINAVYRIVSGTDTQKFVIKNWCKLDDKGTCTIPAPPVKKLGALIVDWVQPVGQHWILTGGVLMIAE